MPLRKNIIVVVFVLALICVCLTVGFAIKNRVNDVDNKPGMRELPGSYSLPALHKGSLVRFSYRYNGEARHAMVYLPSNYESSKKYNILYLAHGYGGTYMTFLGTPSAPRALKNILDHMIEKREIKPLIVVTPDVTGEEKDYYGALNSFENELTKALIPKVESKYSAYGDRIHRAFGGFSMGGIITWMTFQKHLDKFEYFLPMSCAMYFDPSGTVDSMGKMCAEQLRDAAVASGYSNRQYYIFSASGSKDFMCAPTRNQIEHMKKYKSVFIYTNKSFADGNLMFQVWKGHKHSFSQSYPYIYNGLLRFFKEE